MLANPWQMQHQRLPGLSLIISGYQKYIWIEWNDGIISKDFTLFIFHSNWLSLCHMDARLVLSFFCFFFFFPFQPNNLFPEDILPRWNLIWMSDASMLESWLISKEGCFHFASVYTPVSACLCAFVCGHILTNWAIKSTRWSLCWVALTPHDSWHNWRLACLLLNACACMCASPQGCCGTCRHVMPSRWQSFGTP